MKKPKAIILRTAGTNCDYETQAAFELAGAEAHRVHINQLINKEVDLLDFQILAIPGGFSYGDDIASGKILANEIKYRLAEKISKFDSLGRPIIGICNGFQVLVKMGILPGEKNYKQTATLSYNDSDKFECRWVYLHKMQDSHNIWTKNLPEVIQLPVAHGEGKFVAEDDEVINHIEKNRLVVFRYVNKTKEPAGYPFNPNGSINSIAGICNYKGNVFGLMPHPERFIYKWQNPDHNTEYVDINGSGWGLQIFKNAVEYVKEKIGIGSCGQAAG